MRLLLVLLQVAVVFDVISAQDAITNNTQQLKDEIPAQVMQKMARNVELIAKTMTGVFSELKAFRSNVTAALSASSTSSKAPTPQFCSPPFIQHGSMCLLAICSPAQWSVARQTCVSIGSDLIWLENIDDHERANAFFKKSCASASQYWTSLRQLRNGKFVWGGPNESKYSNARILNRNRKNFASNPSSTKIRGQPSNSSIAFIFCRQAPKTDRNDFKKVELKDVDIASFAVNLGRLVLSSCSAACVSRGPKCVAFHLSSAGTCFIISKTNTEFWSMKAGVIPSPYFVRVKNLASNCSSAKFPFSHGASRYRFEEKRRTWNQSRANCEALGGKLVEFPSLIERNLILTDSKTVESFSTFDKFAFTGARQRPGSIEPKGGWVWYKSGLPVSMSRGWRSAQPDNCCSRRGQDVATMDFPRGTLMDVDGERKLSSVCECSIVS